jgi:UDP-N-acetylmuramoyl-tripeptide--D-alanyl-D-alanine ligase
MEHATANTASIKRSYPLTIGKIAQWSNGTPLLPRSALSKIAGAVWNDSRSVACGDVFVALTTEKDDGHRYVRNAVDAGAAAVIVAKNRITAFSDRDRARAIAVTDPLTAVQRAGARYRQELDIPVIGITGSSGKTTTRAFTGAVLKSRFAVGETYTNWNNHIGVPLSLLRFTGHEAFGVIEMGANHREEIRGLSRIARPDVAIITNIGYSHVGLFGSLTNTTKAKFEIIEGLDRRHGFMLLNGDDARLRTCAAKLGIDAVYYGCSASNDIRAEEIGLTASLTTVFTVDGHRFTLSMPGRHFVYCALPAIYLGREFGISLKEIAAALRAVRPLSMRGGIRTKKGVSFIVDCYNANPSSMLAGLRLLDDVARKARRVAIVGEMLELGRYATKLHYALGTQIAGLKCDRVLAIGEHARQIAAGARAAGLPASRIDFAENAEKAVDVARSVLRKGDMVLLKASRGVHLEKVFEKF